MNHQDRRLQSFTSALRPSAKPTSRLGTLLGAVPTHRAHHTHTHPPRAARRKGGTQGTHGECHTKDNFKESTNPVPTKEIKDDRIFLLQKTSLKIQTFPSETPFLQLVNFTNL